MAEEHESRCVALETAYVRDAYEQISTQCYAASSCSSLQGSDIGAATSNVWPRVRQFLDELEPGALVCDVGCGSGKYLDINPTVFKVGVDQCTRLTQLAREKECEVMACDNLALPFRDDTFDAVLSIAVVHHFATTDRRVRALRELARVLRIGGRLLISVWAMEQRHRKFESQDVLVPWHRPRQQHVSTPSLELTSTATSSTMNSDDILRPPPYHACAPTYDSDSGRSVRNVGQNRKRGRSRHKSRSQEPPRISSSQSSSDLSSPNETCYSFVRKALQKLAGSRRGARRTAWFLESWRACTRDSPPPNVIDSLASGKGAVPTSRSDEADALALPIELRRLEDVEPLPYCASATPTPRKMSDTSSKLKSLSLGDIVDVTSTESLVRSRSSVAQLPVIEQAEAQSAAQPSPHPSPHRTLVRQKHSLCEDEEEARDCPGPAPLRRVDLRDMVRALPDVGSPRRGVLKQRSLNDELMSAQRQREKARVRQNITKQASLNEQLLSGRGKLGSLRESLLASPRFQQLRSGLNKLTSNPADATKVASQSFKNGFVRILQGWKSETSDSSPTTTQTVSHPPATPPPISPLRKVADAEEAPSERRPSREEGSDSSKDSSLQSDTSVDSEDSFASVIFVPKPEAKAEVPAAPSPPAEKSPPPVVPAPDPVETPPPSKPGTIRAETLKRIQQLLQERAPRAPVFPLVRRSSAHPIGRMEQPLARPIPRLLSLELFNPETDDLDSDSSGVSSPDSVISVMEPRSPTAASPELLQTQGTAKSSLLAAAASVASSLEGAVDAVIQSSPRARRKAAKSPSPPPVPPRPAPWNEECRQHLTEFADRLSEKLLQEIDRYSESCSASRSVHFRTMARFPRECYLSDTERLLPEAGEKLDPERYLHDLQEINSDIGSQLAKLHAELDALPPTESKPQTRSLDHINTLASSSTTRTQAPHDLPLPRKCIVEIRGRAPERSPAVEVPVVTSLIPQSSPSGSRSPCSSLSGPEPPTRQVSWEESPELSRRDATCKESLLAQPPRLTKTSSYETSLSGSTSQESLQSGPLGAGGDALTFHRYYHVFRQGELDTLIERHVDNLHIIASYYDHANWCVVAEKVHVWTI